MSNRNYNRGYAARPSGRTHTGGNRSYGNEHGTGKARYAADRYEYWYGSEAPVLEPWEEEPQPARRMPSKQGRTGAQNRSRARHKNLMNPALIVFMVGVMCLMAFFLIEYIRLQSEVTGTVTEIAKLETQLSSLKSDNDETLNEIDSSINLDDIKYRAIAQLGMTYAKEDQIVTYDGGSGDYVRQVSELKN